MGSLCFEFYDGYRRQAFYQMAGFQKRSLPILGSNFEYCGLSLTLAAPFIHRNLTLKSKAVIGVAYK